MSQVIRTPEALRATILEAIEAVLEGRINVAQANAVSSLSAELHKSIKAEWDMRCYAAENLSYEQARLVVGDHAAALLQPAVDGQRMGAPLDEDLASCRSPAAAPGSWRPHRAQLHA